MKSTSLAITLGLFLVLVGCGTVGKSFDQSQTENIQNGVTSQAEIKIMFGKPFKTGIQNGQTIWIYEYNRYYLITEDTSKDLVIIFSPDGTVKSHQFMSNTPTP